MHVSYEGCWFDRVDVIGELEENIVLLFKLPSYLEAESFVPDYVYFHCLVSRVHSFAGIFGFHSHGVLLTHRRKQMLR
jgi:hypothetical protein